MTGYQSRVDAGQYIIRCDVCEKEFRHYLPQTRYCSNLCRLDKDNRKARLKKLNVDGDWLDGLDRLEREASPGSWEIHGGRGDKFSYGATIWADARRMLSNIDAQCTETDYELLCALRNNARELIESAKLIRSLGQGTPDL